MEIFTLTASIRRNDEGSKLTDYHALDLIEGIVSVKGWSILLNHDEGERNAKPYRSAHAHLLHLTDDS